VNAPSLNEISRKVEAAARGCGWPIGQALDLGSAAAWLSGHGIDSIPPYLGAIKEPACGENSTIMRSICAIDTVLAGQPPKAHLAHISQPLVLLGLCGWAATQNQTYFLLQGAMMAEIKAGRLTLGPKIDTSRSSIHISTKADAPNVGHQSTRTAPDPQAWAEMGCLAAKILVPTTAASRAFGAGAGGNDQE